MKASEISGRHFDKSAFGYKPDDVDEYLAEIAKHVSQMEKENSDLESKMIVLADKIKEYRGMEDSLRESLLSAQKVSTAVTIDAKERAESLIKEATEKSAAMISEADMKSSMMMAEMREKHEKLSAELNAQIAAEKAELARVQQEVAAFKQEVLGIYEVHISSLKKLPEAPAASEEPKEVKAEPKAEEVRETVKPKALKPERAEDPHQATKEITKPVQEEMLRKYSSEELAQEKPSLPPIFASTEEKKEETENHTNFKIKITEKKDNEGNKGGFESRFGDLKFGKNNGRD